MRLRRRTLLAWAGATAALSDCVTFKPITQVPAGVDFRHPDSEEAIVAIVKEAMARGAQVRVRGSLHSHGAAIFTDPGAQHVNVQLDRYDRVLHWDDARRRVTVQAGIHLGEDPQDARATWARSLTHQLEQRGWALLVLGGITHQTVGGFLSTGSAGGSLRHDLGAALVEIRVVAGDGQVHTLAPDPSNSRDEDENPFYAAGVSMGLLGILSTVTFQCVPSYAVEGELVTLPVGSRRSPCDLFADGERGLKQWLGASDYARIVMWPQEGVERCQYWRGNRTSPVPATRVRPPAGVSKLAQRYVAAVYDELDRAPAPYTPKLRGELTELMNLMLADDVQPFHDAWLRAIPIDNAISDVLLPTEFTDLFIDAGKTAELMTRLAAYWAQDKGLDRVGPWGTEIYATKASPFWMSPTHRRDAIRLDLMWFKTGQTKPEDSFYPQYWRLLEDLDLRFHWGKHLSPARSATGAAYRRRTQDPEVWDRFMAVRARMDPQQRFVTSYWREHLGIPLPPGR